MSLDVIQSRLEEYKAKTKQEEINSLKEIYQEIAICGLARSEFFKKAAFQGGTCLRIIHGLKRFSEDLDFILLEQNSVFSWEQYLKAIELEFKSFGLILEVLDRSKADGVIKKAFLKATSFAKILTLKHPFLPSDKQIIKIKFEIDTNPPAGSFYEIHYLEYPYPFSVLCQDLPSLFASKCHALLRRKYNKGRDWFDFLWYVSKKTQINYKLLTNALCQNQVESFKEKRNDLVPNGVVEQYDGCEVSEAFVVDKNWVVKNLTLKVDEIDWNLMKLDVEAFLNVDDRKYIDNWNRDLFHGMIKKLDFFLE